MQGVAVEENDGPGLDLHRDGFFFSPGEIERLVRAIETVVEVELLRPQYACQLEAGTASHDFR